MPEITREKFKQAVGRWPDDEDLRRANCSRAGQPGHWFCGWNAEADKPNRIARPAIGQIGQTGVSNG